MNEDKWQFVIDKQCYYCHKDLSKLDIKQPIVTGCPNCNRSFVD